MSEPITSRDHALRVTALEALAAAVGTEYEKAREEAAPVFAAKYTAEGNDRQLVLLPDGEAISRLTIKGPAPSVAMHRHQPEKWAQEHIGDGAFEEYIDPDAVSSAEVIEAVKKALPHLVKRRLRPGTKTSLVKEILDSGGWLRDKQTDAKEQVADVGQRPVTGAFSFSGNDKEERRARIMAELLGGNRELLEIAGFGPLALPAGGETDA